MGTIDGARASDSTINRIAHSGRRADVIMVRTDSLSMGVFTDPAHMLVEAAEEST